MCVKPGVSFYLHFGVFAEPPGTFFSRPSFFLFCLGLFFFLHSARKKMYVFGMYVGMSVCGLFFFESGDDQRHFLCDNDLFRVMI